MKNNNKFNTYEIKEALYSQLFKNCYTPEEIKEYVITRKLTKYVKKCNLSKKSNNILFDIYIYINTIPLVLIFEYYTWGAPFNIVIDCLCMCWCLSLSVISENYYYLFILTYLIN